MLGFDSYMHSSINFKVDGLQGVMNKFLEFVSSVMFVVGAAAGLGGSYKLYS